MSSDGSDHSPELPPPPTAVGAAAELNAQMNEILSRARQYEQSVALPKFPILKPPGHENLASEFYRRLTEWIQNFDESLDQEHEVGVRLVSFGQAVTFHLQNMGYWNPSLISFQGVTDQGDPVELIQHVSQISVLLLKVERADASAPKKPLGFATQPQEDDGQRT